MSVTFQMVVGHLIQVKWTWGKSQGAVLWLLTNTQLCNGHDSDEDMSIASLHRVSCLTGSGGPRFWLTCALVPQGVAASAALGSLPVAVSEFCCLMTQHPCEGRQVREQSCSTALQSLASAACQTCISFASLSSHCQVLGSVPGG